MNHANFAQGTLAAAVTDTTGTSITVTSSTGFPTAPFIVSVDTEAMLVTVVAGTTWTVTRGYEGSIAATHPNGVAIYHDLSAAEADSIAAKLDKAGGTLTGPLIMDNMDVTLVKLLTLHGEIDDGNSGAADIIDWNSGAAHKSTLTGNVTLAFTGETDLAIGGTATALSQGTPASQAFDDDVGTMWYSTYGTLPTWLQYHLSAAAAIDRYALRSCGDANYLPTNWILQGSSNGADWTTVDTVTNGFTSGETATKKTFSVDSPGSYSYYRITISATITAPQGQIVEMELFSGGITNPSAPCFLTLKLVQDGTGGRTVTWPATVKGTPAINLAANAVSIVYLYWDGTNYYVINEGGSAGTTDYTALSNKPILGTAAAKNIPATGNASATEVVYGSDARLADARTPTAHAHVKADITDFPAIPDYQEQTLASLGLDADLATLSLPASTTISAAGAELINDADAAAQRATLGAVATGDSRLSDARIASDVSPWAKAGTKPAYTPAEIGAEAVADKSISVPTDAASDTKYPSVKAVKDYADGLVAGLLNYRGAYDASVNTYPTTGGSGTAGAVMKGDMWAISVAGVLGGVAIQGGDAIIAKIDTPAQTAGNWNTLNTNISYVPEDQANKENTTLDTSTTKYPTNALVKAGLDGKVGTGDARLSDARTPVAHNQALATITDVTSTAAEVNQLDGVTLTGNNSGDQNAAGVSIADAGGIITGTNVETALQENRTAINLNTAKVTNASHTGAVTGSGALTITDAAVTYAKMQHVSATDKVLGRATAGAGDVEEISCTPAGRALLDDANAAAQLVTLGTAAYSEGTWTPVLSSFTIVGAAPTVTGTYKRIGNLMFIECVIAAGAGGNTSVAVTASSYIRGYQAAAVWGPFMVSNASGVGLGVGGITNELHPPVFAAQTGSVYVTAIYAV